MDNLEQLNSTLIHQSLEKRIQTVLELYEGKVCLASSLGLEDQLLTHWLCQLTKKPDIFVLDTGRLNQETYDVMKQTMQRYNINYRVFFPKATAVQRLTRKKGPNSFYDSIENRKECCGIRKVEPLSRALKNYQAWITGLRKAQSVTRSDISLFEHDKLHNLVKINPLFDWTFEDVSHAVKINKIPYNKLHDKGYPSIGCEPCTRAIKPGEPLRNGRWWWEHPDQKECGLHIVNGKLVPKRLIKES